MNPGVDIPKIDTSNFGPPREKRSDSVVSTPSAAGDDDDIGFNIPGANSYVDTPTGIMQGRMTRNRGISNSFNDQISWKRAWTDEEDEKLRELTQHYGTAKWAMIAESFKDRTGKQCRERWHNHLAPAIKKGDWTDEEDLVILALQKEYGNQWSKFTKHLSGRTDNAVKNRFHVIQRAMKSGRGPDLSKTPLPDLKIENKTEKDLKSSPRRADGKKKVSKAKAVEARNEQVVANEGTHYYFDGNSDEHGFQDPSEAMLSREKEFFEEYAGYVEGTVDATTRHSLTSNISTSSKSNKSVGNVNESSIAPVSDDSAPTESETAKLPGGDYWVSTDKEGDEEVIGSGVPEGPHPPASITSSDYAMEDEGFDMISLETMSGKMSIGSKSRMSDSEDSGFGIYDDVSDGDGCKSMRSRNSSFGTFDVASSGQATENSEESSDMNDSDSDNSDSDDSDDSSTSHEQADQGSVPPITNEQLEILVSANQIGVGSVASGSASGLLPPPPPPPSSSTSIFTRMMRRQDSSRK